MKMVFDTSVLVAAARSRLGASHLLARSIPTPEFQLCLSVGLYTERVPPCRQKPAHWWKPPVIVIDWASIKPKVRLVPPYTWTCAAGK